MLLIMKIANMKLTLRYTAFYFGFMWLSANPAFAGFLDMPDTEEVPDPERETMLLDLDVPNVRERDPDPQGGPRLNVKEFRVQGIVEYPKLGITRSELIKRVEKIRFDIMNESALLEGGYTLDELSEVSDLLADIEEETKGEHVTSVEVQRLVFLIRDQRRKRGVTLGMIESVADVITRFYREHGFVLAKAYIPEQRVRDGVVTLTLLLGELGEVSANENKRYSDRIIERVFDSSMGKPVTAADMEERLYLVNDLPGLNVRGYFEPGSQVGDTRLNINAAKESWYSANVRIDNHGTEGSGENRLYADTYIYNPTKTGDQIQLGVLASFEPSNTTYGMFRYQTSFFHPRLVLSFGASSNEFTLDNKEIKALNVSGKSKIYDITTSYKLRRSRISNHSLDLVINNIKSNAMIGGKDGAPQSDTVNNLILGYNFDILNERRRILHQGGIHLSQSKMRSDIEGIPDQEPSTILDFNYALLNFFRDPLFKSDNRIMLRTSGQFAGESLASSVQYSLGGPTVARALNVNEFYADDGLYAGIDWIFNGPGFSKVSIAGDKLSDIIQPYFFVDGVYGVKKPPLSDMESDDITAQFGGAGFGLKINLKGIRGNFLYSSVIHREVDSDINEVEKGSKVYFDLQYSF